MEPPYFPKGTSLKGVNKVILYICLLEGKSKMLIDYNWDKISWRWLS